MKRFLLLSILIGLFIACDYASESVQVKPDVEIAGMNPLGWYTYAGDTTDAAAIEEVLFIPENSVDCYLTKLIWEYVDESGTRFHGPEEIALYLKITGREDSSACACDTFYIYNISLPLSPIFQELSNGESATANLYFVFVDEYYEANYDTAATWYGIYMFPQ